MPFAEIGGTNAQRTIDWRPRSEVRAARCEADL